MTAVLLTLHTLVVLGLIGVVLLQRSDGAALGIGGGGGGGLMSGRSAANALTKTTTYLAAVFFATSLALAIFAGAGESDDAVIEELTGVTAPDPGAGVIAPTTDDLLQTLGAGAEDAGEGAETPPEAQPSEEELLDALGSQPDTETEEEAPPATPDDNP